MECTEKLKESLRDRECKNCELVVFCQPCPGVAAYETGDIYKCAPSRKKYAEALRDIYNATYS